MGKIRTRFIGIDEIEEKQKKEQKVRSAEKKAAEKAIEKEAPVADVTQSAESNVKPDEKENVKKSKKMPISAGSSRGKKYLTATKMVDPTKIYSITDAVSLVKKMSYVKFDESVELHLTIEGDTIRGEVTLPHSIGKIVRVAILNDAIMAELESNTISFDVLIAHPSQMPKIAKYARVLGPKGLMPNPKAGTVSAEPEKAAEKFRKGAIRFKSESKFPLMHQLVGKMSLDSAHLEENIRAFIDAVGRKNIKSASIAGTMTPGVRISLE